MTAFCSGFQPESTVAQMGGNNIKWQMCHSRGRQKMGASQQTPSLDKCTKNSLLILCDWVWMKNVKPKENQRW